MQIKKVLKYSVYQTQNLNKHELFQCISEYATSKFLSNDSEAVYQALLKREVMGSTIIGNGVAMPHIISPAIHQSAILIVKSDIGIKDWDTTGNVIKLIVFLLVRDNEYDEILKDIQVFVRKLSNEDVILELKRIVHKTTLQKYIAKV